MTANKEITELNTFLNQVLPNNETRNYVLNFLAHIIQKPQATREILIFQGTGSNGKTTFLDLIQRLLGDRCTMGNFEGNLINKRLVIIEDQYKHLMGMVKSAISEDLMVCRSIYGQTITFTPNFDIILCVNSLDCSDPGLLRRAKIIPFESVFTDHPDPNNPTQFQRDNIHAKLDNWVEVFRQELLKR